MSGNGPFSIIICLTQAPWLVITPDRLLLASIPAQVRLAHLPASRHQMNRMAGADCQVPSRCYWGETPLLISSVSATPASATRRYDYSQTTSSEDDGDVYDKLGVVGRGGDKRGAGEQWKQMDNEHQIAVRCFWCL